MEKNIGELNHIVDLQLPGFKKSVPPGSVGQLSFDERSAEKWYSDFFDRIYGSLGKNYLPVYRMADGEFIFCVGRRPELTPENSKPGKRAISWCRRTRTRLYNLTKRSETTCWGENYADVDRDSMMNRYVKDLRKIARSGMLAIHFTRSSGRFSEQYIQPMCEWFKNHDITLTPDNYAPFYFVYVLLCGPDRKKLLRDKRILIATSANKNKRGKITDTLMETGARGVEFLQISPDRSMLDKPDLDHIAAPADIALVAGGIGSANILARLEPLKTVCLDIGICLEILADETRRGRIFTVPDRTEPAANDERRLL